MSKTHYQDGNCGSHLGFPIDMILAHFARKLSCCYRASFGSNQPKVWEEMSKVDFHDGRCGSHLEFLIGSFSYFVSTRQPDVPHQVSTQLDHSL